MTESCCCPPEAGNAVCDLPVQDRGQRPARASNTCPQCRKTGKPVVTQTVKAFLSASLRQIQDVQYMFCRTQTCPVVYFSVDGKQIFTIEHVRERVYQKELETEEVHICYCFQHTVGEFRTASSADRAAILEDIETGIVTAQCACDLRNPQGSCCLGNVHSLIKRLNQSALLMP